MKQLSIVIITYNRKESLLKQLKSIEVQGRFEEYEVVISDNASNYDISREVIAKLNPEFQKIIKLHVKPVNIGGACNIAFSFQLVKFPWMWMLSDDDATLEGSINQVLTDIERYKDACWLKYSVREAEKYNWKKTESLVDLFFAFEGNFGQYVFMSTNVFSMEKINPFIGLAPGFIHTCFSQQIPAMFAIKNNHHPVYILPDTLVDYTPGAPSYRLHYALSNYCNLVCSQFSLDDKEFVAYKELFSLTYKSLYLSLLEIQGRKQRHEFYKKYMGYTRSLKTKIFLTLMYRLPIIYKIWLHNHK